MRTPKAAIDLIKRWEGLRLKTYKCVAGRLTIGYGHTGPEAKDKAEITEAKAEELLMRDVANAEKEVLKLVKGELTDNELGALVSFVFNLGATAFSKSTLLKKLNSGSKKEAAQEFDKWVYADGKKQPGLIARRAEERKLFEESK